MILGALILGGLPGVAMAAGGPAQKDAPAEQTGRASVYLLGIGLSDLSDSETGRLRQTVENELAQFGIFHVLSQAEATAGPAKFDSSQQYLQECLDKASCVQRIGRLAKADFLFHLHAARSLGGIKFTLRSFNSSNGLLVRKAADFSSDQPDDILRSIRWLTRRASAPMITSLAPGKGRLRVNCDQPDAELFVNGEPFGKTTGKRFKVSTGVFELIVSKKDFLPFHDLVVVRPNQDLQVQVALRPDPEAVREAKRLADANAQSTAEKKTAQKPEAFLPGRQAGPGETGPQQPEATKFYKTWWFWTLVGAGVAGAAGTTAYFLLSDNGPAGQGGFEVSWR